MVAPARSTNQAPSNPKKSLFINPKPQMQRVVYKTKCGKIEVISERVILVMTLTTCTAKS